MTDSAGLHEPYLSIAKDLVPKYQVRYITVRISGPNPPYYVSPPDLGRKMIGSLVAVKFGLQHSVTNGLVPTIYDVCICEE